MSIKYQTPFYLNEFTCLGSECQDTCCRDWEVKLDKKHYELLMSEVNNNDEIRDVVNKYIVLNEDAVTGEHDFAHIKMNENGYCALLDDQGLCTIHKVYGEKPLGNVCAMFPRVVSRCNETVELSAALSCPEVVRLCINDTLPLKKSRFKASEKLRKDYPIQREISNNDAEDYEKYFVDVRDAMMLLVANEDIAFESRLYSLASLAHKLSAFYHRRCEPVNKDVFERVLADFQDKQYINKLERYISDLEIDSSMGMIVIHSILQIKLNQSPNDKISNLYKTISEKYQGEDIVTFLSGCLRDSHESISAETINLIEKSLTRYMLNCLYREWFISMPDPFTYVQMLLVRISLIRFLLYMNINTEMDKHEIESGIIYVLYNFARNFDQNLEFLKVIYNALSEQQMINFDFSAAFIRLQT